MHRNIYCEPLHTFDRLHCKLAEGEKKTIADLHPMYELIYILYLIQYNYCRPDLLVSVRSNFVYRKSFRNSRNKASARER